MELAHRVGAKEIEPQRSQRARPERSEGTRREKMNGAWDGRKQGKLGVLGELGG
jgi:hypothetical protein